MMNISEWTGELWARMVWALKRISSGRVMEVANPDPSKDSGNQPPFFGSIRHPTSAIPESKAEDNATAEHIAEDASKGKGIDKKV